LPDLTLSKVAQVIDGHLIGKPSIRITGISTDSRTTKPGDLFCAILGERTDGHDHIQQAKENGAVAFLTSREISGDQVLVPNVVGELDPVIVALGKLATHVRNAMTNVEVIGITGSSGKTSTKDMIGQVLSYAGATHAPIGSPNNELGLPLTILTTPPGTRFLVAEMGMRGLHHISLLCGIAHPTIGVITNVGQAHIGEVGSIEGIAQAKSELVQALSDAGVAILNADDARVLAMRSLTKATVFTYGFSEHADIRAENVLLTSNGTYEFDLVYLGYRASANVPILGEHNVLNALAASAVGIAVGMEIFQIVEALADLKQVSKWRMEVHHLPGDIMLINDAYNANPESMTAALNTLQSIPGRARTWAVIGMMHELGEQATELHHGVITHGTQIGISQLVAVGANGKIYGVPELSDPAQKAVWLPDFQAATDYICNEVNSGDIVLFKASRSEQFEVLASDIEARLRTKWSQQ
jgi:UDP-N-acetylmuramoyl-tripeptide--D-alanyl-D-alanine ligase